MAIGWEISPAEASRLRLTWTERDGPPVAPPVRHSFELRLIERSLARSLEGIVLHEFGDPAGVTCRIKAPRAKIAAPAEVPLFVGAGVLRERTA